MLYTLTMRHNYMDAKDDFQADIKAQRNTATVYIN